MQRLIRFVWSTVRWRGRASRKALYGSIGLFYLVGILGLPFQAVAFASTGGIRLIAGAVLLPLAVLSFTLLLGGVVRRLHDRNRESWWLLAFFGPHALLVSVLSRLVDTSHERILPVLITGLFLVAPLMAWGMIELFFLRGTAGPNRFGPDPLDPVVEPATSTVA
ncbi:MAG: DUF805 domain-containing protein [Brevundimonas sp.]